MKTIAKSPDLCFARWGVAKCGGKGGKPGPCPEGGKTRNAPRGQIVRADGTLTRVSVPDDEPEYHPDYGKEGKSQAAASRVTSKNPVYGFHGTAAANANSSESDFYKGADSDKVAADAFHDVSQKLMTKHGMSADEARDFLDSTHGRHLADDMVGPNGVKAELPTWIKRDISKFRATSKRGA